MKWMIILALLAALPAGAFAQPAPAAVNQPGIGPTGGMYNGNNLVRSPLAPRQPPNPSPPGDDGRTITTSSQQSRDESGTGAGGGEH